NLAAACQFVPRDGSFDQPNGQVTGLLLSNADLDPETGDVMTFGVTWQPGFLNNNFSIRADYWSYTIDDVITQMDTTFSMTQCVNTPSNGATATIGWSKDKFDAQIGARFIDNIVLLLPSGGTLAPEDNPPLPIDSFVYLDLYFGYNFNDNIKVSLSGTNLSDE